MKKLLFILLCVVVGCTGTSKQSSPFKGEWKRQTAEEFNLLKVDLFEKTIKLPDGSGTCFGYLQSENEYYADYWIIDEVTNIEGNAAEVKVYSWRYGTPEDKQMRTLAYNANQQTVSWKQDGYEFSLSPSDGSSDEEIQAGNKETKKEKSGGFLDTVITVLGVCGGIIALIAFCYFFKIALFYAASTLFFAAIFGILGLLITGMISSVHALHVAKICAYVGGGLGLLFGILGTLEWIKAPFVSDLTKEITKTDPKGTKYKLRDQYGNTKTVKKTGNGVLGETYYEDENGNHYQSTWGNNEVKRE